MSVGDGSLDFVPLLPWPWLAALALAAVLVLGYGLWRRARGQAWRALAVAIVLIALANPSYVVEQRTYLPNIAVVVVDDSPSQRIGDRRARTATALAAIRKQVAAMPNLTLRVVRAGRATATAGRLTDGTRLFTALRRALADVPRRRVAGVIMLTDGQVHDVPTGGTAARAGDAPLHVLLTGRRGERDRRLVVKQAPSYGIVGDALQMTIRVEDMGSGEDTGGGARVALRRDGKPWRTVTVPVGRDYVVRFKLDHAGPTYVELEAEKGSSELSLKNNRRVAVINGVRDRLRVLLISGEPHPGERAWRNLLKADPSVDLVHFTILRPPAKQDLTPISELSLISFPVHELFDVKLNQFDLIIFDRYKRRGVLLTRYLDNIANYVERGGALLVAVGPSFTEGFSLYNTPLGRVLPGAPTGRLLLRGFRPHVTRLGARHPVTAELPGANDPGAAPATARATPKWGRWFRQVAVEARAGTTAMVGADGRPILILDRVGKGRVAQLLSDQIWLWSRGYEGGGPQAELLRRTAHWLMKEPELEEDRLTAEVRGRTLHILRRSLEPDKRPVTVTTPSGETHEVTLAEAGGGRARGRLAIRESGVYRISDGKRTALVAAGTLNPLEVADMRTTAQRLKPVVERSGGAVRWLVDGGAPEIRRIKPGRAAAGAARLGRPGWIGLRRSESYVVTGVDETALLPALLVLIAGLGALLLAWRREGQ